MKILIVNGANLNLTGQRESIYGTLTLEEINKIILEKAKKLNAEVDFFQSNHEGEIIDRLHKRDFDGLIINPGAFTHYSYAIADALRALNCPKIEVHMTNVYNREEFRHKSVTVVACDGAIAGLSHNGYCLALMHICGKV